MSISDLAGVPDEPTPFDPNDAEETEFLGIEANEGPLDDPEQTTIGGPAPLDETPHSPVVVEESTDAFLDALVSKITPVKKNDRHNFKMLLYSEPGVGKTVLAGQAPNNFIVDVEGGLISLNNHPDLIPDSVVSVKHKSFAGLEMIIDRFNKNAGPLDPYRTVTIDSVSELHKRGLGEILDARHFANAANNRYAAETEQHTENNEHIRRLVSSLRDLDRNLILLAHSRTVEPKGLPSKTFPDFSEKLANTLAGIVDVVGYMYLRKTGDNVERVLRFHGNGSIVAKTRIGGFPEEMVDPTWDKIYAIFQQALPLEDSHK